MKKTYEPRYTGRLLEVQLSSMGMDPGNNIGQSLAAFAGIITLTRKSEQNVPNHCQ